MNRIWQHSGYDGRQSARPEKRRISRPDRPGEPLVDEVRNAERKVSSRRESVLIAREREGRFLLVHDDAIIAADVLGVGLRFGHLHMFRSKRRPHARPQIANHNMPFVELTTAEQLKELAELSGYAVSVWGSSPPAVLPPRKAGKVVSIAYNRQAREARRHACA